MTVLECVDAGLSRQNTDKPRLTDTRVAAIAAVPEARSRFRSSLARLAALVRPLMGGSGDTGRPTQPSGPEADPQLHRAQTLALAGRVATGLVHTGDADTGLKQMAGIRANYNRDGHNGPSPISRGMPLSVSYGTF